MKEFDLPCSNVFDIVKTKGFSRSFESVTRTSRSTLIQGLKIVANNVKESGIASDEEYRVHELY